MLYLMITCCFSWQPWNCFYERKKLRWSHLDVKLMKAPPLLSALYVLIKHLAKFGWLMLWKLPVPVLDKIEKQKPMFPIDDDWLLSPSDPSSPMWNSKFSYYCFHSWVLPNTNKVIHKDNHIEDQNPQFGFETESLVWKLRM